MNNYFNLTTGQPVDISNGKDVTCYWGDQNLFFDMPLGMLSITFSTRKQLEELINFIADNYNSPEYSEVEIKDFSFTFDDMDLNKQDSTKNSRNFQVWSGMLWICFNLSIECLKNFSEWLKLSEIEFDDPYRQPEYQQQ